MCTIFKYFVYYIILLVILLQIEANYYCLTFKRKHLIGDLITVKITLYVK